MATDTPKDTIYYSGDLPKMNGKYLHKLERLIDNMAAASFLALINGVWCEVKCKWPERGRATTCFQLVIGGDMNTPLGIYYTANSMHNELQAKFPGYDRTAKIWMEGEE